LVFHGQLERFQGLLDLKIATDLSGLLKCQYRRVSTTFVPAPGKFAHLLLADAGGARMAYDQGCQIYIQFDPSADTPFRELGQRLRKELGVNPSLGETGVYAKHEPGPGVGMHFDANENFMVQLAGSKTWRVAPNRHLSYPPTNYVARPEAQGGLPSDVMPTGMPDDSQEIVMEAGSAAYIPRGYWHETTASSEGSLSFGCTWELPTYGELLATKLMLNVVGSPEWRKPVSMVPDMPTTIQQAERHSAAMVETLRPIFKCLEANPSGLLDDPVRLDQLRARAAKIVLQSLQPRSGKTPRA
jgi:50S ribosomal protein L16 3-hydroxylase